MMKIVHPIKYLEKKFVFQTARIEFELQIYKYVSIYNYSLF